MKHLKYFLALFLLTSCLVEGTDTGNPGMISDDQSNITLPDSDEPSMKGTTLMAEELCLVIRDCKDQPKAECREALESQDNIDTKIGLMDGNFANFGEILAAENDDIITPNQEALTLCIDDIKNLDCGDSAVDEAYDPSDPTNPYRRTAEMIPGSCEGLYN